jgi:hypothetical protein
MRAEILELAIEAFAWVIAGVGFAVHSKLLEFIGIAIAGVAIGMVTERIIGGHH